MISTQPNEKRCQRMKETHILPISGAYPVSSNPLPGSKLLISYEPKGRILEVQALREYVDSYAGGKGDIRSMEGMVQSVTQDCANSVGVMCHVTAELIINPDQEMILECSAYAKEAQ